MADVTGVDELRRSKRRHVFALLAAVNTGIAVLWCCAYHGRSGVWLCSRSKFTRCDQRAVVIFSFVPVVKLALLTRTAGYHITKRSMQKFVGVI